MVKIKNRYYVIRIVANDEGSVENIRKGLIFSELMRLTLEMFGDVGYSLVKMSLSIRVQDEDIVVIRIADSGERYFSAVLPCVLKFANQPVVLNTIFVGRSMRSCEKRLIQYRRDELHASLARCTTPQEKRDVLESIRKICGKPTRIFSDADSKKL